MTEITVRLEELRTALRAQDISYGELHELQSLAEHIDPGDVELLEAAGVPEGADPRRETRFADLAREYPCESGETQVDSETGIRCRYLLVQQHSDPGVGFWHVGADDIDTLLRYQEDESVNGVPWSPVGIFDLDGDTQFKLRCSWSILMPERD